MCVSGCSISTTTFKLNFCGTYRTKLYAKLLNFALETNYKKGKWIYIYYYYDYDNYDYHDYDNDHNIETTMEKSKKVMTTISTHFQKNINIVK